MFYEVRIFNGQGNLKKVVSSQELSRNHWASFEKLHQPEMDTMLLLKEYKSKMRATLYQARSESSR